MSDYQGRVEQAIAKRAARATAVAAAMPAAQAARDALPGIAAAAAAANSVPALREQVAELTARMQALTELLLAREE